MRKIYARYLILAVALFFGTPALGEEYVNKEFPSDEIMLKNIQRIYETENVFEFIGKNVKDNSYEVFVKMSGGTMITVFRLLRLDTNRWVIDEPSGRFHGYEILQK